jgi:hypothetical protein
MTNIIGVGGLLRSGKDSFADELVEYFGAIKLGMSDPLIDALVTVNPLIPIEDTAETLRLSELIERVGYVKAKEQPEVRSLLQRFGTEWGRKKVSEDFWVDLARERVLDASFAGGFPVVITGMRFPNELRMITGYDVKGETVWINRPGLVAGNHPSENSVTSNDFDVVIDNDGDLLDLETKALAFGEERGWFRV